MKKSKYVFLSLAASSLLLVTGCGDKNKTLSCSQNASGAEMTMNLEFSGNKLKSMDMAMGMDLSSYSDEMISAIEKQDFCSKVKSSLPNYKDAFTNCKQNVADKNLKVTADIDIAKISEDALKQTATPEDGKKELEKSGFTCTIK